MQIVLHDYFEAAEGGGRLSLTLAQALHADLGYGFKIRNHPFFEDGLYHGKEFRVSSFTGIPILRQFMLTQAFSRRTKFLQDYNRVIYSGFYSPLAVHNHANGKNIYYCHTPPRFLYDQRDFYLSMIKPWQRPIMHMFNNYLRPRYEASVSKMDTIVANSKNVQARINKYLGHDSVVVHPPCDTESFTWLGQEDYYLSIARLDPLKRVKLVAEAFRDMPDRKLIVVSGGPELEHIKEIAKYTHNITVLGWVHEQELRELLGRCIATIYIPKDLSDFRVFCRQNLLRQ